MDRGIGEARILALKIIAEAFLLSKGNSKTNELFANRKVDATTELSDGEAYVLKSWLTEKYKKLGLNLNAAIAATGEQVPEGKLSKFELNELIKYADELIGQLSVFTKYIDTNKLISKL